MSGLTGHAVKEGTHGSGMEDVIIFIQKIRKEKKQIKENDLKIKTFGISPITAEK